jgi:hypothetical protein
MKFELDVTVRQPLIRGSAIERELAGGARRADSLVLDRVRSVLDANVRSRTGRTRQSFRQSESVKPGEIVGRVRSTYFVSRLLEIGAQPHEIKPRRGGRFLVFTVGGRTVFARAVHHPGLRGRHFFGAATQAMVPAVEAELSAAARKAIDEAPIETTSTRSA